MTIPSKKILLWLNLIILACLFANSIRRDINYAEKSLGDIRNRVVGARLQKDGMSPYFYKWKKNDVLRYYDPGSYDSLKVSGITASPFFNHLIRPICDLPQYKFSRIWLLIEYVLFLVMVLPFLQLASNNFQKIIILNTSVLFTYTEAWKMHIIEGQIYLIYASLISLIIFGLLNSKKITYVLLAAVCAALLIFMRPYALIIFAPFLLQFKQYYKFIFSSGIFIVLYSFAILVNGEEKTFWISYSKCLDEQVKSHQELGPTKQINEPVPILNKIEGFDITEAYKNPKGNVFKTYSEHGNIFVLYTLLLHKKMSLHFIYISFIFLVASLLILFQYSQLKNGSHLASTILFAMLLYMIADLFSPIHRYQYYTVQWYPIVLFGALLIKKWIGIVPILLLCGLCLNITNTELIPMRHTIGEYLWLLSLLLIVFMKPMNKAAWNLR